MSSYYRILTPLSYRGIILETNTIEYLSLPDKNIEKLLSVGYISELRTPPIFEIPELSDYCERLEKLGIYDLKQFINAGHDKVKSIWRRSDHYENKRDMLIESYLIVPNPEKDCNC